MDLLKKIIICGLSAIFSPFFSQVIIGDAVGTAPANNKVSVLLEFANTNNKGIILPYVRTLPATPVEGTILLDASNPVNARVKYYNGSALPGSGGWTDVSGQGADLTTILSSQPTGVNETNARAIIGNTATGADGVLVLESNNKAMILPVISDTNNIPNPSPGMMVYINKTGAKRLAVFNGAKWSYWQE